MGIPPSGQRKSPLACQLRYFCPGKLNHSMIRKEKGYEVILVACYRRSGDGVRRL